LRVRLNSNNLSGTWLSRLQGDDGEASPSRAAWTLALGFGIGMFPLLGVTTLMCALIAKLFRLKQGPMQLGNYAALPFQIILIIPFLRLGERLLGAERFTFDISALMHSMPNVPESMQRAVVLAQWHMIVGWAVVAPILVVAVGMIAAQMLKKFYGRAALRPRVSPGTPGAAA
jgi:CDP-diglyceride synthetase